MLVFVKQATITDNTSKLTRHFYMATGITKQLFRGWLLGAFSKESIADDDFTIYLKDNGIWDSIDALPIPESEPLPEPFNLDGITVNGVAVLRVVVKKAVFAFLEGADGLEYKVSTRAFEDAQTTGPKAIKAVYNNSMGGRE